MLCTILSNPRASPTSSPQPIPTHHPGRAPHIPLAHLPLLPDIPSTQMAISLITCSPSTITRTPSHTIPLHLQMEVSPLTSLDNHSALGRAHRGVPQVRSLHPIGSSSYSNARCVISLSYHGLVLRANHFISSDDSCFSIAPSSSPCQCYGVPHSNKVCNSHNKSQQTSTRSSNQGIRRCREWHHFKPEQRALHERLYLPCQPSLINCRSRCRGAPSNCCQAARE